MHFVIPTFSLDTFKQHPKVHTNTASLAFFPLSGGSGCGGGGGGGFSLSGDLETFMPPPSSSQGGAAMSPVYSQLETALLAFPKVLRQTYV